MPRLPPAMNGSALEVTGQTVHFSLWPTVRGIRRAKLQPRIFTSDPWALMAKGIADRCPKNSREAALAFRAQAEDFYDAATEMGNRNLGAKPLLLYYSFLNLSKAYLLTKGFVGPNERPGHGVSEKARVRQVEGTRLTVYPSLPRRPQLFSQLMKGLTGTGIKANRFYRLGALMPQVLFGHRVWCSAANEPERFLPINEIQYLDARDDRKVWTRLQIDKEELAKLHLTQALVLKRTKLRRNWHFVDQPGSVHPGCVCIEEVAATNYGHRPSDSLSDVTSRIRPYL